jgi:hypothetical protein
LCVPNILSFSTIFTLYRKRYSANILGGPSSNPKMHMLNGLVNTPLFTHLGSSSWHSFDAFMINSLGHASKGPLIFVLVALSFVLGSLAACWYTWRLRSRRARRTSGTYSPRHMYHDRDSDYDRQSDYEFEEYDVSVTPKIGGLVSILKVA